MTSCRYYELHVLILLLNSTKQNVSPRPISIPLRELKAQSTAVGIIAEDTQQKFQLGNVSFRSTVKKRNTSSHDEFEVHLKLEVMISESATRCQLFDLIKLVVRCLLDVSSLVGTRHEAGHYRLVYYNETSKSQYNSEQQLLE